MVMEPSSHPNTVNDKIESVKAEIERIVIETFHKYNDAETREALTDKLTSALVSPNSKFIIVCDETTNPPDVVDANAIRGYVIQREFGNCQETHYNFHYKPNDLQT